MSFAPDSRVAIRRHRFNGQIPKSGGIRVLVLVVVLLLGYIPAAGAHPSAAAQPLAGDTPLKLAVIPPFTGVDPLQAARETLAHRGGPTLPNGPLCSPTQAIATPCAAPDAPVPSLWEPIPSLPLIPPRALMAYDAADRVVLLIDQAYSDAVSGVEPNAAAFYTFNGTGWTQLPLENGPPYALGGAVAYDSTLNSVVYEVPVAI
ncbi:MAG: hypothetical protein L3K08_05420, partial [Thermoplasmata archaeon]|nr:hypothetical protein [Thermoplasmata archaeon]